MNETSENVTNIPQGSQDKTDQKPSMGSYFKDENRPEELLSFIATLVLVVGVIVTIVCAITLTTETVYIAYYDTYKTKFSFMGLMYTLLSLVGTLLTWSFLKVIANISKTLKDINRKMS